MGDFHVYEAKDFLPFYEEGFWDMDEDELELEGVSHDYSFVPTCCAGGGCNSCLMLER